MEKAGVSREGERGVLRTFHSLRHSYARQVLETGLVPIDWVQRQLGHSSIVVTIDKYGHWSREAERAQADVLEGVLAA